MYLAKTGDPVALSATTFQDQFLKLDINNECLTGFHDDRETQRGIVDPAIPGAEACKFAAVFQIFFYAGHAAVSE